MAASGASERSNRQALTRQREQRSKASSQRRHVRISIQISRTVGAITQNIDQKITQNNSQNHNWCHFSNYLGIEFCAYPASLGKESHPFLKHGGNV
jgi:hypothetical protein